MTCQAIVQSKSCPLFDERMQVMVGTQKVEIYLCLYHAQQLNNKTMYVPGLPPAHSTTSTLHRK